MALTPTEVNRTIKLRLDQQLQDWNASHGTNLNIEQYLYKQYPTITQKAIGTLLGQYKAATEPGTPAPTSPQEGVPEIPVSESGTTTTIEGVPETPTKPNIIQATPVEIHKVLKDKASLTAGTLCPGGVRTINLYSITTRDGEKVYVYSLSKKDAKQRAIDSGYKVAWVGSIPSGKIPKELARKAAGLTSDQQWVKDYLTKEGAWKNEYIAGEGFDLVRMLDDSLTTGSKFTPNDLRKMFGDETIDEAFDKLPIYRGFEKYKDSSGNYDLIGILEDKTISKDTIGQVFGKDTLKWAEQTDQVMNKLKPYKTDDGYNLTGALYDKAITLSDAELIFDESTINQARAWVTLSKASPPGELEGPVSTVSGMRTATEAEMAALKNAIPLKDVGLIAADCLVPFLYVARHWNEISTAEKAILITIDVAFFIAPLAGAAVRGARGAYAATKAAKLAIATSKSARLAGAAKGVGKELVAMIRGPVETIMHPVATTKQGLKDMRALLENVLGRKKIPEAVLSTTQGSVRLKVTDATSLDDFMKARDKLISLAAKGDTPVVQLKGKSGKVIAEIELTKAPLMREAKGGIVHTTPWGEQFKEGLTVRLKPGLPRAEQGIFVSHEPLPRFAKQSAFNLPVEIRPGGATKQVITTRFGGGQVAKVHLGAEMSSDTLESLAKSGLIELKGQRIQPLSSRQINKLLTTLRDSGNTKAARAFQETVDSYKPMFRIISPDKADNIISSGKLYRGSAEIEAKIPIGARIEPPKQILYTRIGPESTRVEIWLDKPLSARQIIKLKAEGLAEVFRQPFRTPLKIKGVKGRLTQKQVKALSSMISDAGNTYAARSLLRTSNLSRSPARLMQLAMSAIRVAPRTATAARVPAKAAAITRARTERAEPAEGVRRQVRAERAEEVEAIRAREREDREERIERGRRVKRAERPERTARTTRADVRDWPVRIERAERIGRTERIARVTRAERAERAERPVRPVRPERPARPVRPERPIKPTRPALESWPAKLKQERLPSEKPGLVTWKQGMYYITVVEPYRTTGGKPDVIYSRYKPPWGVKAEGRRSPSRSLRATGRVPKLVKLPMGAVSARVKNGKVLRFRRRN